MLLADPGDAASHDLGMANGSATGAVMSSGGLSEFSRMLSVFINCSKLKASSLPTPCLRLQLQADSRLPQSRGSPTGRGAYSLDTHGIVLPSNV